MRLARVEIATELGTMVVEVFEDRAPASAAYFLADVRSGLFDGTSFFRIVTLDNQSAEPHRRIEVIQGGLKHAATDLPPAIPHETTAMTGLTHRKGTISLARFAPGAVYHSFFICLRDEPALDFGGARHADGQGFAAFGRVAEGFEVVERIFEQAEANESVGHPIGINWLRIL